MGNILIAHFRPGEITKKLDSVSQYDYGKSLHIIGLDLPPLVEVHFSTQKRGGEAPRQLGTTTDGVTEVDIPDTMLANNGASYDYYIYAFVYLSDAEHGETIRQIIIPVKSRPKPADFAPPSEPDLTQKVLRELSTKLTAPSSAQVGQIFRVQSINEDGNLVLEAVDMPSGGSGGAVDDVQINGASIVDESGVAAIPLAHSNGNNPGLVEGYQNSIVDGIAVNKGNLSIQTAPTNRIDTRSSGAITIGNLDYAVKTAMCDGKGAEWTDTEKTGAWQRLTSIKTTMDEVAVAGARYLLGEQSEVTVVLPDDALTGQEVTVAFYNGETPATLSIMGNMLDFDFTPTANTRSEISCLWDGNFWSVIGMSQDVPVEEVTASE